MATGKKGIKIVKNVSLSLLAQGMSLTVGFILNLIVPKYIDEYQYAYWHTFLLYVGYVGVLHFGLLDGLVLRYSQYDYEELDKDRIRSEFLALLIIITISWLPLFILGVSSTGLTKTVLILVSFGILTKNIFTYNSYLFQITNRIHEYAFLIIMQRLVLAFLVLLFIFFNQQNFIWYCIADLAGDVAGIFISYFYNKELYFGKILSIKEILQETWLNISSGILLMFANWSAMLSVSGAKMIIEWKWGALVFGKSSFAFSVSNLFMSFILAISIVLFPSLKRNRKTYLHFI